MKVSLFAPVRAGTDSPLLRQGVSGRSVTIAHCAPDASALDDATVRALTALAALNALATGEAAAPIAITPIVVAATGQAPAGLTTLHDPAGTVAERCDLRPGSAYLIRPDQHVAARWRSLDVAKVQAALSRAAGRDLTAQTQPVAANVLAA